MPWGGSSFQSVSRHQEPGIQKIPKIQDLHGGVPLSLVHLSSPRTSSTSSISHKTQEFHRLQTSGERSLGHPSELGLRGDVLPIYGASEQHKSVKGP